MPSFLRRVRTLCLGSAATLTHSQGFEEMGCLFLQHPCTQNMPEVPPFEHCSLTTEALVSMLSNILWAWEPRALKGNSPKLTSWDCGEFRFSCCDRTLTKSASRGKDIAHHCGKSEHMAGIWLRNNGEARPAGSPSGQLRGLGLSSFLTHHWLDHLPPENCTGSQWTGPSCVN